jgi:hypothetical protein
MDEPVIPESAATTTAVTTPASDAVTTTTEVTKPVEGAVETKPESKTEEGKPEAKPTDKPAAPEAYTDFKAPEGVELDTEVLGDLKTLGKELGLSQENAQKVFDLGLKMQQRQGEAWQAQMAKWVDEAKADKEFGGEKFAENLALVQKAVTQFGSPDLKAYLDKTGLGNHPEMVKTFYRIGKAISADGFVPGGKNTSPKSIADRLYPTKTA